jgi:hypothetical protein
LPVDESSVDDQSVKDDGAPPRLIVLGRASQTAAVAGPLAYVGLMGLMLAFHMDPRVNSSVSYHLGFIGMAAVIAFVLAPLMGLVLGFLSRTTARGRAGMTMSVLTLLLVVMLVGGSLLGRQ